MLEYLRPLLGRTRKIRLVHGEPEASAALVVALRELGFDDVTAPSPGDTVEL
jgi:predicted metal-dependent RNase